jgi:hypothetical protein
VKWVTADCFLIHQTHSSPSAFRQLISHTNKTFFRATDPSHHLAVLSLHRLLHNSQIPIATASLQALADVEGTTRSGCSRFLYVLPFGDPSLTNGLKEVRPNPCVYERKSENKVPYFIATKQPHIVRCLFIHLLLLSSLHNFST